MWEVFSFSFPSDEMALSSSNSNKVLQSGPLRHQFPTPNQPWVSPEQSANFWVLGPRPPRSGCSFVAGAARLPRVQPPSSSLPRGPRRRRPASRSACGRWTQLPQASPPIPAPAHRFEIQDAVLRLLQQRHELGGEQPQALLVPAAARRERRGRLRGWRPRRRRRRLGLGLRRGLSRARGLRRRHRRRPPAGSRWAAAQTRGADSAPALGAPRVHQPPGAAKKARGTTERADSGERREGGPEFKWQEVTPPGVA